MKSKADRRKEGDDKQAMQKLANVIPDLPVSKNINHPFILLDYGKHEIGLSSHTDVEYEDVCNVKQGFLAIIDSIEPADTESRNSILL